MRPRQPAAWYIEGILAGQIPALSQAITLAESLHPADNALVQAILAGVSPLPADSFRLGVTGSPGVGKSTFIEALGTYWAGQGHRLAVLAVDPSSTRTGGSILGDKTRMATLSAHPQAFIRPSPAAGALGGVNRATRESILLCEAAGFTRVIVETVGVGQSETSVRSMVDAFLLLVQPGAGDDLQGIKRGIMEMADLLAVTRTDLTPDAARLTAKDYQAALQLYPPGESGWQVPVLTVGAPEGRGLPELDAALQAFQTHARQTGWWQRQRQDQQEAWFVQAVQYAVWQRFMAQQPQAVQFEQLRRAVAAGELQPGAALQLLFPVQMPNSG